MNSRVNPNQLVLRRDTATGFAKVNWASEMPLGRFDHIKLVCEARDCMPLSPDNPIYNDYQLACDTAKAINEPLLTMQIQECCAKGWLSVPLNLDQNHSDLLADDFGSYQTAAMRALFRLTANVIIVWAVVFEQSVTHIESCQPPKPMEELEYQVWKHHVINRLSKMTGTTIAGKLIVNETGLWFSPDTDQSTVS